MPNSPPLTENRRQNKNTKNRSSVASRMDIRTTRNNNNGKNGHKNIENPSNPKPPSPMKVQQGAYKIPDAVLADICFRFLDNIPDHEKIDEVRVCFQIEQAHWFYEDFVCKSKNYPECKHVGFKDFARQIFNACDYLDAWKGEVDSIIEHFRMYKSNVPTYGAILLDETLTYILLVQGWFASKNNWGFPKGKVNEHEDQTECAIREVFEETGYDISSKLNPNIMFTNYINDTMVCLYLVCGVEMGFDFRPHARKEIRKITWFSVWDLPVDRFDHDGCARLELTPQNFYTVLPFVKDIQAFIRSEQAKRMKAQPKVLIGQKSSSAFEPVVPKPHRPYLPEPSFQQSLIQSLFPNSLSTFSGPTILTTSMNMNIQHQAFIPGPGGLPIQSYEKGMIQPGSKETLFKPLKLETSNQPASFTGEAFLEMLTMQTTTAKSPTIASQNPGVIGGESLSRRKEIKHPKPLHSNLKICVYEASNEHQNTSKQREKPEIDLSLPSTSTALPPSSYTAVHDNEIANMLMSTVSSSNHLDVQAQSHSNNSITPQRNKNHRQVSPSSNIFMQSTNQTDNNTSPEPYHQPSGSMRKRGARGRKRNRGKSQTEHVEKDVEKDKDNEKNKNKTTPNPNLSQPSTSIVPTAQEQNASYWQNRGISIDLNALFGAAAKASTSQASLSPRSAHPKESDKQNSTSPVLRLLQNLSISPNVTVQEKVQPLEKSLHVERMELNASPYDNCNNGSQYNSNFIVDRRNSHESESEEDKDRPIIQLCNTWKSFKLDTSKLLLA